MPPPIPALHIVSTPGARDGSRAHGFVDLDDRVSAHPVQPGVLLVCAPRSAHVALTTHLARRLRTGQAASSRGPVVTVFPSAVDALADSGLPVACELGAQLGVPLPSDAFASAEAFGRTLGERAGLVVAPLPAQGTWDRAVITELARSAGREALLVFITDDLASAFETSLVEGQAIETTTFLIETQLTEADKLRWLSGVAEEVWEHTSSAELGALEDWWALARRVSPNAEPSLDGLSEGARRLLACLVLARRSLPVSAVVDAWAVECLTELVARAAVTRRDSVVSVLPWVFRAAGLDLTQPGLAASAARMLVGPGTTPDPWAHARAAALWVDAGSIEQADAAMDAASRSFVDSRVAREIGRSWLQVLEGVRGEVGLTLRVRAAERALAIGDAREAQRWCESATTIDSGDATTALLMGRALMQLGDHVAARIALNKSLSLTTDPELRARNFAELAEVAYLAGEQEEATASASRALALGTSTDTQLAARNTIGKVLLAEGRWDDADAHFAEDALTAAASEARVAELRARINRAIAFLSRGALDDARELLELVREDGARFGVDQAVAHAYLNLGVIAYSQRDYGAALAYWEATVRFPHTVLGRKLALSSNTNLAEVRLFLGLLAHAEHGLAFGRRLLAGSTGAKALPILAANLKRVAAQVALARGNVDDARREIEAALVDAESSRDHQTIEVVTIVAIRVALDEGDVRGAEAMLAHAGTLGKSARTRAEFAILAAHRLRAVGKSALEAASAALALAHEAKDVDLLAEIYLLLATIHRDAGDSLSAQVHAQRAERLRNQVAETLSPSVRAAYLAKAENVALSRLQASLCAGEAAPGHEEEPPSLRAVVIADPGSARELVGDDPQIRTLNVAIRKVARSNATVLIRGESGTGKELVAEALHRASECASGPLVSVNCAALVETLLLSELFGHEKGAFTGASARRRGRFELAEGGTLFLDEIGDISPRTQVALLRVLQEKTFERVGGTQPIKANVRIVCATHRDLKAMVERGEFREDLYYRLRGITLEVPALRARLGDLPKIAEHLLSRIANERGESPKALTRDAIDLLSRHRWPGNIRELENVLRAVSLFAESHEIDVADLVDNVDDLRELAQAGPVSQPPPSLSVRGSLLPPPLKSVSMDDLDDDSNGALPEEESGVTASAYACVRQGGVSLSDMKRQIERDCIARALADTQGNITKAAALLGMKRPRLSQLVKQYGLSAYSEGSQ